MLKPQVAAVMPKPAQNTTDPFDEPSTAVAQVAVLCGAQPGPENFPPKRSPNSQFISTYHDDTRPPLPTSISIKHHSPAHLSPRAGSRSDAIALPFSLVLSTMAASQWGRSLLRANTLTRSSTITPFLLLPTPLRSPAASRALGTSQRGLSTTTPHRADSSSNPDNHPPARKTPFTNEEISNSLGDIVGTISAKPNRLAYRARTRQNNNANTTSPSSTPSKDMSDRQSSIASGMGLHLGNLGSSISGERTPTGRARGDPAPAPVRLDAYVGRAIRVNENAGLGAAIRLLEITIAREGVKREFNEQRFHERAGLKRKRLRSARWRRRFKLGFQATVTKVKNMRRMGW